MPALRQTLIEGFATRIDAIWDRDLHRWMQVIGHDGRLQHSIHIEALDAQDRAASEALLAVESFEAVWIAPRGRVRGRRRGLVEAARRW